MSNMEVCADKLITKNLKSKWEGSYEVWDDEYSHRVIETCLPELTDKIAKMGDEGRKVASEMEEIQQAVKAVLASC